MKETSQTENPPEAEGKSEYTIRVHKEYKKPDPALLSVEGNVIAVSPSEAELAELKEMREKEG